MTDTDDNWADQEARSITKCCGNYADSNEKGLARCRSCGRVPVGWNAKAEVQQVLHSQMELEGGRVWCPACEDGVVPVGCRNPDGEPIPDRCTMCGQGFWFIDLRGRKMSE
jgi:hypothetical protein